MVDIPSRSMFFTCGPREDDCAAHRNEGESTHVWLATTSMTWGSTPPESTSTVSSPLAWLWHEISPSGGPYDLCDMLR